jgi:hypothetical protein
MLLTVLFVAMPVAGLASDPVAELQKKIDDGAVRLEYDAKYGYLVSLLKNLNIPVSSQTLVFSKTSLQSNRISPSTPRALYFNDEVYVAWIPDTLLMEVMSVDAQTGAAFYILNQENDGRPQFERSTGHECSVCHFVREAAPKFVPLLMMTSVVPDAAGEVDGIAPIPTTDRSPFVERWGGWYVTGRVGNQKHLGNVVLKSPASAIRPPSSVDLTRSSNVTDLSGRFDTSRYLSAHSDVVALMVIAHQMEVQNLIALAGSKSGPAAQEVAEELVRVMLFSGAVPSTEGVEGTTSFAMDFAAAGPRDSRGRSLRDLDLKTRLFRYPLSYLIYTRSFDEMPAAVKSHVYRRLREVLSGADKSANFSHLSTPDRQAILEILRETKPDFAAELR